jgi:hypothetical protein
MKERMVTALLGIAALAAFPSDARAASSVLDDFTTGPYRKRLRCGSDTDFQNGTMIGSVRNTHFLVACGSGANPFEQPASIEISKGGPLAFDSGIRVFHRVEVVYGSDKGNVFTPLSLDLSAFDRLRVRFDANDLVLNFNVVVFMRDGTARAQAGCNIEPHILPFNVDLRLASDFVTQLGTADWSDVDAIALIFQSGSAIGANDYAVTAFSATDEADPGARLCSDIVPSP